MAELGYKPEPSDLMVSSQPPLNATQETVRRKD